MKQDNFDYHYVLNPNFKIWMDAVNNQGKPNILLIMYFHDKNYDPFYVAAKYVNGGIHSFYSAKKINFAE